jgi:transposase-like protein
VGGKRHSGLLSGSLGFEPRTAEQTFPAEHWVHLRTTNPISSTFSTVRLRTKVTRAHESKAAGLAMAFKLRQARRGARPRL